MTIPMGIQKGVNVTFLDEEMLVLALAEEELNGYSLPKEMKDYYGIG